MEKRTIMWLIGEKRQGPTTKKKKFRHRKQRHLSKIIKEINFKKIP